MPIRRIVRATCAALILGSLLGIPGDGTTLIANYALGASIALFLLWASLRPGYRIPAFGVLSLALPAWALLLLKDPNASVLAFGAAMLVGMGSCIVHYQSDPQVLRPASKR